MPQTYLRGFVILGDLDGLFCARDEKPQFIPTIQEGSWTCGFLDMRRAGGDTPERPFRSKWIYFRLARHPAGTKNYQGWFLSSAGSCCSNMVDSVAGAGDPSAYANASG